MTNANGKVDSSLIDMNAVVYKGVIDVSLPNTLTSTIGDMYMVLNKTNSNWDPSWGQGTSSNRIRYKNIVERYCMGCISK